jgi:hypothetical protein
MLLVLPGRIREGADTQAPLPQLRAGGLWGL